MSLVNDMLRDLDQRRKDSEGPAARIRLTPAGDYPNKEQRNWIPFIGLAMVVAASALGYLWIDMTRSASSQQLSTSVVSVGQIASGPVEEIAQSPGPLNSAATVAAVAQTEPTIISDSSATQALVDTDSQSPATLPTADVSAVETSTTNSFENLQLNAAPNVSQSDTPVSRPPPISVRNRELTNTAPEPVKGVTAPTPEQKDTMMVQEALQLIANNQHTAAYARLEQNLLDNPYAHQSRETYAKFLMNQGDVHSAGALMDSGLELAPNHSGFKKVKARLLIEEGDIASAVTLLASRAPEVANDLEYHEILASAQLASRDFDGAALSYTGLVQQDYTQGRWWYGFAAAQDSLGNITAARQAYSRALEQSNLSTNLRRRSQDRLTALSR